MSTMSKRTMWIEPAGDMYRFWSEQTTSVRTLVEHLKGDYPDIIENPSKYVMKWPYNEHDDQDDDQDGERGRVVSLDDMIHLPDREFYFYIVNSSHFRCMAENEDEDNELNGYPLLGYNDDVRNLEYLYYLSQIYNINECIEQMIVEYENDGELDDGWIREYLYNYIQFPQTNADVTLEDMAKFIND